MYSTATVQRDYGEKTVKGLVGDAMMLFRTAFAGYVGSSSSSSHLLLKATCESTAMCDLQGQTALNIRCMCLVPGGGTATCGWARGGRGSAGGRGTGATSAMGTGRWRCFGGKVQNAGSDGRNHIQSTKTVPCAPI